MSGEGFKLTYVFHDCFLLETAKCILIFDYWKVPDSSSGFNEEAFQKIISDDERAIYVFVSHFHKDHFNRQIFQWAKLNSGIKYIVSNDVFKRVKYMFNPNSVFSGFKPRSESVIVLKEGQTYEDNFIKVNAFGSTDVGNSYSVFLNDIGKQVFHAGDLNAWIWKDEESEEECERSLRRYLEILDTIKKKHRHFNLTMFPVDSRIGSGYFEGARLFVEYFNVELFVPMHFELAETEYESRMRKEAASDFEKYANPFYGTYVILDSPGKCLLSR